MTNNGEKTVAFGSNRGLIGVFTQPENPAPGPPRAVLMSNIGTHHRVGPFRLYVELARALARAGFYVLRFDHSGMGDSEPRPGAMDDNERILQDMFDAMAWLSDQQRIQSFVVVGLCSGVTGAHAAAAADERVRGAVFIDGYAFPTTGFRLRRLSTRYLAPQRWIRYVRRKLDRRRRALSETADYVEPSPMLYTRSPVTHGQFQIDIARITQRGARLLFIYTGTVNNNFNHARQLFEMLGPGTRRDVIEVDLFAGADHLFSSLDERRKLIERISGWFLADRPAGIGNSAARIVGDPVTR